MHQDIVIIIVIVITQRRPHLHPAQATMITVFLDESADENVELVWGTGPIRVPAS